MVGIISLLRRQALSVAVVLTTVIIIMFAVVQYRWSDEVNEATAVRLADTLQMAMTNWQIDLLRNLSEMTTTFQVVPSLPDRDEAAEHVQRVERWLNITRYQDLVARIYVLDPTLERPSAWRLDPETGRLDSAAWPVAIDREDLAQAVAETDNIRDTWRFQAEPPALIGVSAHVNERGPAGYLVIELDPAVLRDRIFSDLAHRYFQGTDGLDYEVAVTAGSAPRRVMYTSDPGFGSREVGDADGTLNIFGRVLDPSTDSPITVFHEPSQQRGPTAANISWLPLLGDGGIDEDWELVVRHRRGGPLGTFMAATHRRDLAISFTALLLLVASIAMLVMTSHRAQRLASLQMDFVTTVSHELRTPLAVISSAADNIAQGVVEEPSRLKQYGTVIGHQVRQLSGLVEQILLFASQGQGAQRFTLEPLAVTDIINATLASTEGLVQAGHFTVEHDVEPGLPPVSGDLVALSQCLQNLVTNALKYGRDQRWMRICASLAEQDGRREIQIAVSDRGIGIAPREIARIFEPFYRSPSVTAAQIRGTGLGLSLARRIAEAMNGRVTVTSEPDQGSTFTIHLPCAEHTVIMRADLPSHTATPHG
jgi:signal transduction histidine kinase